MGKCELVTAFWRAMDKADFTGAAALMHPHATVDWPLSNERMTSSENWRLVNANYPGHWRTRVESMVSQGDTVVTVTTVFDGGISDTAISIFTIADGRIHRLVEYWPETYARPSWRAAWTVRIREERPET
jgi:ketosteroid isomerase-like protein